MTAPTNLVQQTSHANEELRISAPHPIERAAGDHQEGEGVPVHEDGAWQVRHRVAQPLARSPTRPPAGSRSTVERLAQTGARNATLADVGNPIECGREFGATRSRRRLEPSPARHRSRRDTGVNRRVTFVLLACTLFKPDQKPRSGGTNYNATLYCRIRPGRSFPDKLPTHGSGYGSGADLFRSLARGMLLSFSTNNRSGLFPGPVAHAPQQIPLTRPRRPVTSAVAGLLSFLCGMSAVAARPACAVARKSSLSRTPLSSRRLITDALHTKRVSSEGSTQTSGCDWRP